MTTKRELRELYSQRKLKEQAIYSIGSYLSLVAIEVVHGVNDKLFGYYQTANSEEKNFFLRKIKHDEQGAYVTYAQQKHYLSEFVRVQNHKRSV